MIRYLIALVIFTLSVSASADAARSVRWPGPYGVDLVLVEDGDSVIVEVLGDCPFGCYRDTAGAKVISIRLRGIDAAEIHACRKAVTTSCAACPAELAAARQARAAVEGMVGNGRKLRVVSLSPDKYRNRVVGDLQVQSDGTWQSVSAALLARGLVVPYDGGRKKKLWCAEERK